jgi:hypothetical protein
MFPRWFQFLPLLLCIPVYTLQAQEARNDIQARFRLNASQTSTPIKIDGKLNESTWQMADTTSKFWLKWPIDGRHANAQTRIQCAYNEHFLYIAATCYQDSGRYILQSLKRDADYWESDGIAVVIDPVNLSNNGYFFGLTPAGVQTEALVSASNGSETDENWDNVWWGEVQNYPGYWTAEFAIPLRIMRFKDGQKEWGINFIRNDANRGHYSTWVQIPLQFMGTDLGWTGVLQFAEGPKNASRNYAFIPFVTAGSNRDTENGIPAQSTADLGLDAKIGIGSSLNLDLTINPDFSQIEIDEQVINLTRFNIQLPEKRTFFLENADLFGNFGFELIRPFFSRRIGLDENGNQIPILAGLRLTGNISPDTRIGVLNMQTRKQDFKAAENFSAFTFDQRLFGRTTLRGYFLNRQQMNGEKEDFNSWSRNLGGEFLYISPKGTVQSWVGVHQSYKPGVQDWWGQTGVEYTSRNFSFVADFLRMGPGYYADMGYELRVANYDAARDTVLRIGYGYKYLEAIWTILPKEESSKLNNAEISANSFLVFNPDLSINEHNAGINVVLNFRNTSQWALYTNYNYANVPVSFKFDDEPIEKYPALPAARYVFPNARTEWTSDVRKPLNWSLGFTGGAFYNGLQWSGDVGIGLRAQPWGNFRLSASYNKLDFPAPYADAEILAITPRVEFFFNRNLNWTTFLQYNTQANNFNINSRVQWRYRPMSDVFLVLTDNYFAQGWAPRNRALVLKVNYWL